MSKRLSFVTFLGASFVIHGALIQALSMPDNRLTAAGPPPALVAQGNSFADMVEGAKASKPDTVTPSEVDDVAEQATLDQPTPQPRVEPTEHSEAGVQLHAEALQNTPADMLATTAAPLLTAVSPAAPVAIMTLQPAVIANAAPEVIEALPEVQVNDVTATTVRPPTRPVNLGKAPPPPPTRATPTSQVSAAPQGNATQSTRRGAATATSNSGQQAQTGQGQQVDQAAVAAARQAAANYGNDVMRRISRTRRENTRSRGIAVVSFRVAGSGQLSSVGIAQSSGDAGLDQIAVNHVRRSAPFPAPPEGARTSFSIQFQGR
jgi:protein TonB